jgi:hypothetical protein
MYVYLCEYVYIHVYANVYVCACGHEDTCVQISIKKQTITHFGSWFSGHFTLQFTCTRLPKPIFMHAYSCSYMKMQSNQQQLHLIPPAQRQFADQTKQWQWCDQRIHIHTRTKVTQKRATYVHVQSHLAPRPEVVELGAVTAVKRLIPCALFRITSTFDLGPL